MDFGLYRGDYELWRTRLEFTLYEIVAGYNGYVRDAGADEGLYFTWSDAKRAEKVLVGTFEKHLQNNGHVTSMTELSENAKAGIPKQVYMDAMRGGLAAALPMDLRNQGDVHLWGVEDGHLPAWMQDFVTEAQTMYQSRNNGAAASDEAILDWYLETSMRRCNGVIGISAEQSYYNAGTNARKSAIATDKAQNAKRRSNATTAGVPVVRSKSVDEDGNKTGFAYPVSPFDSRFEHLESMRALGMRMGYLRGEDLEREGMKGSTAHFAVEEYIYDRVTDITPDGGEVLVCTRPVGARAARGRWGQNPGSSPATPLCAGREVLPDGTVRYGAEVVAESLVTTADECGLTRLAGRMTPTQYGACRKHVLDGVPTRMPITPLTGDMPAGERRRVADENLRAIEANNRTDAEYQRMRDDADIAVGIIDALSMRGLVGSIEKDRGKGQLKLVIDGDPQMDIRVFDTKDEGRFIGRVYADGITSYLATTERIPYKNSVTGEPVLSVNEAERLSRCGKIDKNRDYVPYQALDVENAVKTASGRYVSRGLLSQDTAERHRQLRLNSAIDAEARSARIQQRIDDAVSNALSMAGGDLLEASTTSTTPSKMPPEPLQATIVKNPRYIRIPLRYHHRQKPKISSGGDGYRDYFDRDPEELYIRRDFSSRTLKDGSEFEFNGRDANDYLSDAIKSARIGLMALVGLCDEGDLDAESLDGHGALVQAAEGYLDGVRAARAAGKDLPAKPVFEDGGSALVSLQRAYFDVLVGGSGELPSPTPADVGAEGALGDGGAELAGSLPDGVRKRDEGERPEDFVRRHFDAYLDSHVGTFEEELIGDPSRKQFSITSVATHMGGAGNEYRNQTELVAMARKAGISPHAIKVVDAFDEQLADRLAKFDEESARSLDEYIAEQPDGSAVRKNWEKLRDAMVSSLNMVGCAIHSQDILIDDKNRVHYSAIQNIGIKNTEHVPFEGEIGPLYVPDADGYVSVTPEVSTQYKFAPVIIATVLPTDVAAGDMYERMRGIDYMSRMAMAVSKQLQNDVIDTARLRVGQPNSLFPFYRRESAQTKRHGLNWEHVKIAELGTPQELVEAVKYEETHTVVLHNALCPS